MIISMNSDELAKDVLGAEELLEIQQERKVGWIEGCQERKVGWIEGCQEGKVGWLLLLSSFSL